MPAPARSVVASMRGWYLASWRYGRETERLVDEALERERWTASQWQEWTDERLAYVLDRAARQVPYYRDQWAARRRQGDRRSPHYLEHWPILEKESLRTSPEAFLAADCDTRRMFHEHTSGTSGTSLDLWWSRDTVRQWYALFEARTRRWYGVSRKERWAILGGQLVTPVTQREPPFWVWNTALNQLYMSSYHLAPDLLPAYLDAIARYRPTYLFGYTSALYTLAQEAIRLKRRDLQMRVVVTNAEPMFDYQRETIAAAFQCAVRETYGMAEIVAAASECEQGSLHQWPEVGIAETVDEDDVPRRSGGTGDLVCTGLLNADMPLIRYRVGDRADVAGTRVCECRRSLPSLARVEGRSDDVLYTRDGRAVGRLDPIFKGRLPIREAQLVQERLDRIRVRFVPAADFDDGALQSIRERLRARMGPVDVLFERMERIERTNRGKFRAVISQLSPDDVRRVRETMQTVQDVV